MLDRINPYETQGCLSPKTEKAKETWEKIWDTYRTNFMTALRNSDMEIANGMWVRCAENYLAAVTDKCGKDGKAPGTGRWEVPTFKEVKVAAPQNEEGEGVSTTRPQLEAMKFHGRKRRYA